MDNWQAGDLALCVRKGLAATDPTKVGGVYTVARVWRHPDNGGLSLDLAGLPNGSPYGPEGYWGHIAARFRKIKPLTPEEHEETMHELLTGKPAKEPVSMALAHCEECNLFLRSDEGCLHIPAGLT